MGLGYVKCNVVNEREDGHLRVRGVSVDVQRDILQADIHGIMRYTCCKCMHKILCRETAGSR